MDNKPTFAALQAGLDKLQGDRDLLIETEIIRRIFGNRALLVLSLDDDFHDATGTTAADLKNGMRLAANNARKNGSYRNSNGEEVKVPSDNTIFQELAAKALE